MKRPYDESLDERCNTLVKRITGLLNASKRNTTGSKVVDYAQHVKRHTQGKFVVAPNGAGKSYYIEHDVGKNWVDQDPFLEAIGIHTRGSDGLSEHIMKAADNATATLKQQGVWVMGATWWKPGNVDCFVVPSDAVIKERLSKKSDKFPSDWFDKNVAPHIKIIKEVAEENDIPIYADFDGVA